MPLTSIVSHIKKSQLTEELYKRTKRKERLVLKGGTRSARALISTAIAKYSDKPILVVAPTLEDSMRWYSLLSIMGWQTTHLYPTTEASPYDQFGQTTEITWGQLQVLSDLLSTHGNSNLAIVTSERALQPHLPPRHVLTENCIQLVKGNEYKLDDIAFRLSRIGYKRESVTSQEATWSRRGDIVDIYPVNSELPIRLEFFGDMLDKLREFDPISQRTTHSINKICITPTDFSNMILEKIASNTDINHNLYFSADDIDKIGSGSIPEGMRRYIGLAWDYPNTILDYLPTECQIVVDNRSQVIAHANEWIKHIKTNYEDYRETCISSNITNVPPTLHTDIEIILEKIDQQKGFDLDELSMINNTTNNFDIASRPAPLHPNQFGRIATEIKTIQSTKASLWILSAQPSRCVALLEEHECLSKFIPNNLDLQSIDYYLSDNIPIVLKLRSDTELEGLCLPAWKINILTDREFYGQSSFIRTGYIRRRRASTSKTVDPNKMVPGDYVVHKSHGIGKFIKMDKISITGQFRDYLVIQYLDGKLSVAADQLGSLNRYRANSGDKPNLNKMGGTTWNSTKQKAKKAIKKIAADLLKLYAERSKISGFSFPADGPWQQELEDSFPFDPTPDQLKAVKEVKNDMEKTQPMDRLVCGDVGFGKTEVAIRAIFKAITSGKQTVFLAPTTILAQQHWRTLTDRFAPYPIKVSLLNRFKTTTERKKIIDGLEKGTIDAVVGTHQLLSGKIKYSNLGLLVVDEEQRFGVNQKEKIKSIKTNLDVLTLSATPIPRTLYMSLSGVREMSLINTPPPLRRSIKTHLAQIDDETVRSAIVQEIDRGGQVFYVVPKIEGIEGVEVKLKEMLPQMKIITAHGQMLEGDLESSMIAFNSGEADIMLCTTIIESGLDIPRVNTILIEDSHMFGLSQLYQLRGRVGRSGIQAHAWLFFPGNESLSEKARQRLRAIQEFSQLGSGYHLATRDMEIRGVGNLLGVQQSGQMETIGFDLYMEMLQECLAEIQGQEIPVVEDTQIDLSIPAFIPSDWIQENELKISAYRDASQCTSKGELIDLASQWNDRYGLLPKSVNTLLDLMELKLVAKACAISRISPDGNNIKMVTPMDEIAFRQIRKALPDHIHSRFIYKKNDNYNAQIIVRGLGSVTNEQQISQLIEWLKTMSDKIVK